MAQDVDRNAAEQVEVALSVDVGDDGPVATGQGHRRGAVVVHHHGFPAPLDRFGVCPVRHAFHLRRSSSAFPIALLRLSSPARTTLVPVPSSGKSSTSTQCSTRPSMTCALGTPAVTARRRASTLGIMPASSVGNSCDSVAVSISLTSESRLGQLV